MERLEKAEQSARELLRQVASGDRKAAARLTWWDLDRHRGRSPVEVIDTGVTSDEARHVIARESGFRNWGRLQSYFERWSADLSGQVAIFEDAVQAVIDGDLATLRLLVSDYPELAQSRSGRDHQATLLHYVAANGVENDAQRTPSNIVETTKVLMEAGADQVANATCRIYEGGTGSTPLIALVTSGHPYAAGVQAELVRVFCQAGAAVDGIDNSGEPLQSAIGFRYLDAAEALVECGARVDNLPSAAALGQSPLVEQMLDSRSGLPSAGCHFPNPHHTPLLPSSAPHPSSTIQQAFVFAAMGGTICLAERLLAEGADVNRPGRGGIRAVHEAAWQAEAEMIQFLVAHGASLELKDHVWNSNAAEWAEAGGHPGLAEQLRSRRSPG